MITKKKRYNYVSPVLKNEFVWIVLDWLLFVDYKSHSYKIKVPAFGRKSTYGNILTHLLKYFTFFFFAVQLSKGCYDCCWLQLLRECIIFILWQTWEVAVLLLLPGIRILLELLFTIMSVNPSLFSLFLCHCHFKPSLYPCCFAQNIIIWLYLLLMTLVLLLQKKNIIKIEIRACFWESSCQSRLRCRCRLVVVKKCACFVIYIYKIVTIYILFGKKEWSFYLLKLCFFL